MKMPKHDVEDNHSNDSNNNHFTVGLRGCKSASADTNHPNDTSRKQEDSPLRIALADKTANSMLANPLLWPHLIVPRSTFLPMVQLISAVMPIFASSRGYSKITRQITATVSKLGILIETMPVVQMATPHHLPQPVVKKCMPTCSCN